MPVIQGNCIRGEEENMPDGAGVLLWLLIPVLGTTAAWYLLRRRARQDPNADIAAGVSELESFRRTLRRTNPPPGYEPRPNRQRQGRRK